MTEEWNPHDPEATRVHYDLSGWTFDQQAELAADLAEAEIPHGWEGTELIVPEQFEAATDSAITTIEQRLGILNDDANVVGQVQLQLSPGTATTEYDLAEMDAAQRQLVGGELIEGSVPFRWEGDLGATLVVHTADEETVEAVLDAVESGAITALSAATDDDDDPLPFETLTTFFLAGERLQRNPLNADGLEDLMNALDVADPGHPPYGVERRLWERACELAEEITDALVEGAAPDQAGAQEAAADLHDLLRPYV